jgi:hypothetical protein
MTSLFHGCDKEPRSGRCWLGLCLLCALGLAGCKAWGGREEGLRKNDLAVPARQLRAATDPNKDKGSKPVDDPWMSEKAQKIARDLQ